jgi:hypothetical protein
LGNRSKFLFSTTAACVFACGATGAAPATHEILWSDLRPAATDSAVGEALPEAPLNPKAGDRLSWGLKDKTIELTGYALPVDRDGDLVYEFMLLPLTGICSHVPPPPANQMVLVTPEKPYKLREIYEPVSVSGVLKPGLEKTQLFILDGVTVMESGYSVAKARVIGAESVPDAMPQTSATPWNFLKNK